MLPGLEPFETVVATNIIEGRSTARAGPLAAAVNLEVVQPLVAGLLVRLRAAMRFDLASRLTVA